MFHGFPSSQPRMNTRILVVEDDANIRLGLQELLASEGFEVVVCARGDEVEAAVRRDPPSLILLDVMLPRLSGYDVCRQLRKAGVDTPILMLTAKSQEMDRRKRWTKPASKAYGLVRRDEQLEPHEDVKDCGCREKSKWDRWRQ